MRFFSLKERARIYFILFVIVAVAFFLRFYRVDEVPVSLYWDEVSAAYNAYSIAITGKDEFGRTLPLLFRAFEDFKAPGNIYLTAPIVRIFGLNEYTVRFTSFFFGTLTVFITFFLVKELFEIGLKPEVLSSKKAQNNKVLSKRLNLKNISLEIRNWKSEIALLSAGILAITPWHINFSRTGFEANVAVFFIVLSTWLFIKSLKGKVVLFFLSMMFFALSFYMYRSTHVFLPLFLPGIFLIFRPQLLSTLGIKNIIVGLFFFFIVLAPFAPHIVSSEGLVRAKQTNAFIDLPTTQYYLAKKQLENSSAWWSRTVYNRRLAPIYLLVPNYIKHFNFKFLFLEGDGNLRHGVKGMGLLHIWMAPFIILGTVVLFFLPVKVRLLILLWLIIAPIPAALSLPAPHALRSLNILPIPQILTAIGLVTTFAFIPRYAKVYAITIFMLIVSISMYYYLYLYYNENAKAASVYWADGYKQLTHYIFKYETKYDKVIISGHYWQPYIYFLFYKQYDPKMFQEHGSKQKFDKYLFGGTSWDRNGKELHNVDLVKFAGTTNTLVALSKTEYRSQEKKVKKLTEIRTHDGQVIFIVGEL